MNVKYNDREKIATTNAETGKDDQSTDFIEAVDASASFFLFFFLFFSNYKAT